MNPTGLLFFAAAYLGANLLGSNLISPYLGQLHGLLFFHVAALIGWLIFFWMGKQEDATAMRRQFLFTLGFITLFVGSAFIRQIDLRGPEGKPIGIHDGGVQVEVAGDKLVHGNNPYTADYRGTPYEVLNPRIPEGPETNVVWSHFIYPPFTAVIQALWTWIANTLGVVPDVRWIFILALVGVTIMVVGLTKDWERRTQLLLLTAGNPLLWLYVVAGYNDILMVTLLVGWVWALHRKRWIVAGVFYGLAIATKQSVWLTLPLAGLALWQLWKTHAAGVRKTILAMVLTTGIIFVPFLIANPAALYDDIIRYASGSIPYSYPISGATLIQYLRVWGIIHSSWTVVQLGWIQLMVGGLTLTALWRWMQDRFLPERWLMAAAVIMTSVLLVSRYNNNNYLMGIFGLVICSYAFAQSNRS